ncbi:MAG: alpha/beta hydrolase family protein, partial [Terracidiphilus sp.]
NVHFQNTVQFVQALSDAKVPYNLEIFPRKTHSLRGTETKTDLYRSILQYFQEYLLPARRTVN